MYLLVYIAMAFLGITDCKNYLPLLDWNNLKCFFNLLIIESTLF